MHRLLYLLFLVASSCNQDSKSLRKEVLYCPITTFYLGWNPSIKHRFEGNPTPCEKEIFEKGSLFAIDSRGLGIINFEEKKLICCPKKHFLTLKPYCGLKSLVMIV
jgi:hypothetical protein